MQPLFSPSGMIIRQDCSKICFPSRVEALVQAGLHTNRHQLHLPPMDSTTGAQPEGAQGCCNYGTGIIYKYTKRWPKGKGHLCKGSVWFYSYLVLQECPLSVLFPQLFAHYSLCVHIPFLVLFFESSFDKQSKNTFGGNRNKTII